MVLAGAGAGSSALVTAEAAKWLSRAEVVVYDRLADPACLRLTAPHAERIDVGKTPGRSGPDQGQINALLIRRARAGRLVVRLKGGDPLVFGRGGEEAEALAAAGVAFRIVPGVTAAAAAAACAGIPLTDRRCASSVALVTGHEDPAKAAEAVDFDALARVDTVVFYMGVKRLADIAQRLIAAGRDPATPAAVVASAGTPGQRTVVAALGDLPARVAEAGIRPPAVTIVGEVVRLREKLRWFERLPLFGRTVLVTRPAGQAEGLSAALADLAAAVIEAPAVEIAPPADAGAAEEAVGRLGEFDLVVFTSVNGVEAFAARCRARGLDGRALSGAKVAAIGPATAAKLRAAFIEPDIVPERFTTADLGEALAAAGGLDGRRVLLARADIAAEALPEALAASGAEVEDVAFYRTLCPASLPSEAVEALRAGRVDWATFTSSSSVTNFLALLGRAGLDPSAALAGVRLAAIGPVTAETLSARGLTPAAVAEVHTTGGMVAALVAAT